MAAPQKAIIFTESQRTQDDLLSLLADPHYGEASSAATAQTVMLELSPSTLSGLTYWPHIREWQALGYRISLLFLMHQTASLARARVAERVRQGGHDIAGPVIRRRFTAGKYNFVAHYREAVHAWGCYDNSGDEPIMMEWGENT